MRSTSASVVSSRTPRLQGAFDQRNIALRRQVEVLRGKQRLLLEVQDGILQQLTAASLGLQLGEVERPLEATGRAIEQAKAIVSETIEQLLAGGSSLDDILRESVTEA